MGRIRIWIALAALVAATLAAATVGAGAVASAPGSHLAAGAGGLAVIGSPAGKRWF